MRRNRAIWGGVLVGLTVAVGCRHESKYETDVPLVEEFREPPHEARFDNPPEQGYQKARAKKEFKPGVQGATMPGGGMGSPGGMGPR